MFFTVPQGHQVAIMRLGKFSSIKGAGFRFKLPFIDTLYSPLGWNNCAVKEQHFIELAEQQLDPKFSRKAHTKDNLEVEIDCSIYWQIVNTKKALFDIDNLIESIKDSCLNAMRDVVGNHELDQLLGSKNRINDLVTAELRDKTSAWGISIRSVEIQEIITNDETASAMRQEMVAERKKRAMILEAEGEAASIKIRSAAESEYLDMLIGKIGKDEASRILLNDRIIPGVSSGETITP